MQTSATIEARGLTKTYKDVRALDGLGFAAVAVGGPDPEVRADRWPRSPICPAPRA
jgi:hypothetical protein